MEAEGEFVQGADAQSSISSGSNHIPQDEEGGQLSNGGGEITGAGGVKELKKQDVLNSYYEKCESLGLQPHRAFIRYLEETYDENDSLEIIIQGNDKLNFSNPPPPRKKKQRNMQRKHKTSLYLFTLILIVVNAYCKKLKC